MVGRAGRWAINEKGLVASAGALSLAPPGFAARAQRVLAHVGETPHDIAAAVTAAQELVRATAAACESGEE